MFKIRERLSELKLFLDSQLVKFDDSIVGSGGYTDFTEIDRAKITKKVREYVDAYFTRKSVSPIQLLGKEECPVGLDICFWVMGEMRASAIVADGRSLRESLELCTRRALQDGRFRMLESDEREHLLIEITFFGNDWKSVTNSQLDADIIDPVRGIVAVVNGSVVAWYIPAVHNVLTFSGLREMSSSLLFKKGRLSTDIARKAKIFSFSTVGWIETSKWREGETRSLSGPVPSPSLDVTDQEIEVIFQQGLAWILRQEISPGAFRPKCEAERLSTRGMNWPRLSFTSFALAEVGREFSNVNCTEVSVRIDRYISRKLPTALYIDSEMKALAMLYSGRSAIARGDIKEAQKWLLLSEPYMNTKNQGPITRLQYAMLLASSGTESLRRAQEICLSIYSEWLGVRDNAQLALYAEMIPLNVELSNRTGDNSYIDRAMSIADWYVSMQCDDGSFPLAPQKHLPYTRGTGKIIEALATIPKRYREVIRRSFRYLGSMQYTQSSTYHIASNMEGDFLGGFRHDALDRDSWIDGAAHVVLAVARWRKFH